MPVAQQLGSHSEEICHFGGATLRVNGSGNLRLTFYSLNLVDSYVCAPLVMQLLTGREPTRLANFISQRGMLQIQTTAINEYFTINRVIVHQKPLWTQYPG